VFWLLIVYLAVMAVVAPILGLIMAVLAMQKGTAPRWVSGPNVFFGIVSTLLIGPAALLVAAEVGNAVGAVTALVYALVAIPLGVLLVGVGFTHPGPPRFVAAVAWFSLAFHASVALIGTWSAFRPPEQMAGDPEHAMWFAGPCIVGALLAALVLRWGRPPASPAQT